MSADVLLDDTLPRAERRVGILLSSLDRGGRPRPRFGTPVLLPDTITESNDLFLGNVRAPGPWHGPIFEGVGIVELG